MVLEGEISASHEKKRKESAVPLNSFRNDSKKQSKFLDRHVQRVLLTSCIRHLVYDHKMIFHLMVLTVVVVVARVNLSALRTLNLWKRDSSTSTHVFYPTHTHVVWSTLTLICSL